MKSWIGLVVVAAAALAGCDKNCQNTCARIYDESECGVQIGGVEAEDLKRTCQQECEEALQKPGPMGDYNPYNVVNPTENFTLENERQAATWMDCVWELECSELEPPGRCWPIP